MLNSADIKKRALELGADLVGIGSIDRFEGSIKEKDPRYIAPSAKSIIGLGFRVLRGSLRGIEEGTQFYQFPTMGVLHIDEVYAPAVLRRVACFLEDHGYEGTVLRAMGDRRLSVDKGTNPELTPPIHKIDFTEPVADSKPAPDVNLDFQLAAYICGLGEIGLGGFFLTPEFGPLQRFAFILTDAELEPDDIYKSNKLCDECGKCIKDCPGNAILKDKLVKKEINGEVIQFAQLDEWQCTAHYMGINPSINPFMAPETAQSIPDIEKIISGEKRLTENEVLQLKDKLLNTYCGVGYGYNACICGKACWRACLVHLENRGVLSRNFKEKFRKKPAWKLK
jgi:ferredoxin